MDGWGREIESIDGRGEGIWKKGVFGIMFEGGLRRDERVRGYFERSV